MLKEGDKMISVCICCGMEEGKKMFGESRIYGLLCYICRLRLREVSEKLEFAVKLERKYQDVKAGVIR